MFNSFFFYFFFGGEGGWISSEINLDMKHRYKVLGRNVRAETSSKSMHLLKVITIIKKTCSVQPIMSIFSLSWSSRHIVGQRVPIQYWFKIAVENAVIKININPIRIKWKSNFVWGRKKSSYCLNSWKE